MGAGDVSIDDYIKVLITAPPKDRLRIVSALTESLVRESESIEFLSSVETEISKESSESDNSLNETNHEPIQIGAGSKENSDEWKSLWGAWENSTPDNLMDLIRADRGPEKEPPNFDL